MIAPEEAGRKARFQPLDLAAGVHAALADRRLVLLDVRRDRYFRLSRRESEAMSVDQGGEPLRTKTLQASLAARGLCRDEANKYAHIYASSFSAVSISPIKACAVIGACLWADRVMRTRPFADVLRSVARPMREAADGSAMAEAVRTFLVHRPFYPRDYACLFEALALLRYLAQRGRFATWVFGVRGAPFSAHCWLEAGGAVLNDDPDTVAAFVPIMAV